MGDEWKVEVDVKELEREAETEKEERAVFVCLFVFRITLNTKFNIDNWNLSVFKADQKK